MKRTIGPALFIASLVSTTALAEQIPPDSCESHRYKRNVELARVELLRVGLTGREIAAWLMEHDDSLWRLDSDALHLSMQEGGEYDTGGAVVAMALIIILIVGIAGSA